MRKITLTLLLFALVGAISADELKINFHFTFPIVKDIGEYSKIEMENCRNLAKPGEPVLLGTKSAHCCPLGMLLQMSGLLPPTLFCLRSKNPCSQVSMRSRFRKEEVVFLLRMNRFTKVQIRSPPKSYGALFYALHERLRALCRYFFRLFLTFPQLAN